MPVPSTQLIHAGVNRECKMDVGRAKRKLAAVCLPPPLRPPIGILRPLINPVIPSVLAISIRATAKPNAVGWDKIWFYLAKQRKGDQLWNSRE